MEEFTGEHCTPCATSNPTLQNLIATNSSKVLLITYPTPLPVAGPLYNIYTIVPAARISYYGITTAPQGRLDGTRMGTGTGNPTGHVANFLQADINTASAAATPFNLSISHTWSVTGDSVTATVTASTPSAYSPTGVSLRLRVAVVENLNMEAPPGVNGEQYFPNLVRDLIPSPAGTTMSSTWTASQTTVYTITAKVGHYLDKNNTNLIAWIQNDADKSVLQSAMSTPVSLPIDAASIGLHPSARLHCVPGNASLTSNAVLRNAGTDTLRSARIFYHTDVSAALQFVNWSGALAPNGATLVALGSVSIPGGNHYIVDSVALPNGKPDVNHGNNTTVGSVSVYNTNRINLPIVNGFELAGAIPQGWILYDADSNGRNFAVTKDLLGGSVGYGGSKYFLLHNNFFVPAGETNYAILPAANLPSDGLLSFAYAHAPYNNENDELAVVYSTDCGANWTSVWSAAGTALSTASATTDYFIPAASQWSTQAVDFTGVVPNTAMIAFRAISDYGNTLYIDNVRLESKNAVESVAAIDHIRLYPNPAKDMAEVDFTLSQAQAVRIKLTDMMGRTVAEIPPAAFPAGRHQAYLSVSRVAPGVYRCIISGEGGQVARPLSIVR